MKKNILVTGGAGFIGSNLVAFLVEQHSNSTIVNIDALTYASNYNYIKQYEKHNNYSFFNIDIRNNSSLENLFLEYDFDIVIHLAAESHVDNSIDGPIIFAETNVMGTLNLLEVCKNFWHNKTGKLFYHISTDEVYGSLGSSGKFSENTAYDPRSPYSASKAASDHFVRSYFHTYNLPVIISNCSNNFGPNQHKEKLIPTVINCILNKVDIPIYGDGKNVRDWLYVKDHVLAIDKIIREGRIGETYNIGGGYEISNFELVNQIISLCDALLKNPKGYSMRLISFVADRKGHDFRYSVDFSKIKEELKWMPSKNLEDNLKKTILWYINSNR